MWKHQVQESLKNMGHLDIPEKMFSELNKAQSFHLGEVTLDSVMIREVIKREREKQGIFQDGNGFLKFPYDEMFFDFFSKQENGKYQKAGIFIQKTSFDSKDIIQSYIFSFDTESDSWFLLPCMFVFTSNPYQMNWFTFYDYKACKLSTPNEYASFPAKIASNTIMSIADMGIRILTCRNIKYVSVLPPSALNKKRKKRGKLPICEYKVLVVDTNENKLKYEHNGSSTNSLRVHLCRGHFKEYTNENPLFGKHVGRFWWQPMVRGDKKRGVLNKDYDIIV